jgi:hypothetical protein
MPSQVVPQTKQFIFLPRSRDGDTLLGTHPKSAPLEVLPITEPLGIFKLC